MRGVCGWVGGGGGSTLSPPTLTSNCYSITHWKDNSLLTESLSCPWKQLCVGLFLDIHWSVIDPFTWPQCLHYSGFINLEVSREFQNVLHY